VKKSSPGPGETLQPMLSAVPHPKSVAPYTAYNAKSPPGDVSPALQLSRTENTAPTGQTPFFGALLNGIPANWFPTELRLFLLTAFCVSDFPSMTGKKKRPQKTPVGAASSFSCHSLRHETAAIPSGSAITSCPWAYTQLQESEGALVSEYEEYWNDFFPGRNPLLYHAWHL